MNDLSAWLDVLPGVIGSPHDGSALDMPEAKGQGGVAEFREFLWGDECLHW